MTPLADDIVVVIGGEAIELRPSLRFAMRLARREGGFPQIMLDIAEGSLTAACEIIRDHTDMGNLKFRAFEVLPSLRDPLIAYVGRCTGIEDEDVPAEGKPAGKPVTFEEHLTGLYRIGTGWLGWTPGQTLDATPAEIREAYRGRLEMLKAIFGGAEEKPTPKGPKGDWGASFAFAARARNAARSKTVKPVAPKG